MTNSELLNKVFELENKRDWGTLGGYLHPDVMWFVHGETAHSAIAGREDYLDALITDYKDSHISFICEGSDISKSGNRITAVLKYSNNTRTLKIVDFEDSMIRWVHEFLMDE